MVGAKVKTRPLLSGSPCCFPAAHGESFGQGCRSWWAQRADPRMTLGNGLPPCPETLRRGWGRPPSGLLGGSRGCRLWCQGTELGLLFSPVKVSVAPSGACSRWPGDEDLGSIL